MIPPSEPPASAPRTTLLARVQTEDVGDAVACIARQFEAQLGASIDAGASTLGSGLVLFFASSSVPFEAFATEIHHRFGVRSMGCSTAGEICSSEGHCEGGVVAAFIPESIASLDPLLVRDASKFDSVRARDILASFPEHDSADFALMLTDGLTMSEERVSGAFAGALGDIPLIGGSAGDDLAFERTWIAVDGESATDAVGFAIGRTDHAVIPFHTHQFDATDHRLVISDAVPEERRVTEIDGLPAAEGYAQAIGMDVEDLSPEVFAAHPLALRIGEQDYIRSILCANPDGSLTFYCAIEAGLVLRIARGTDLNAQTGQTFDEIRSKLDRIDLVITFDCILRRLELIRNGVRDEAQAILRTLPTIGFSTYGEQFSGLHVNQTMTGIALGVAA